MLLKNGELLLGWPLANHIITQGYYYNDGSIHRAIDMRAIVGTPVAAAEDGEITIVYHWNGIRTQGDTNSYGNMVKLKHDSWKGGSVETLYAHLNSTNVKVGQKVKKGDIIGYSGNTGNSFGAHLHFEVRYKGTRTNPLVWLDNDFTLATGKEYTFGAGEHSVDTSVGAADSSDGQSSTTTPSSTGNGCMDGVAAENEIWGIDVSKYQGTINWRKVAAAGVKFAFLRVVSTNNSGIYIDPTFEQNYNGATENGIPVGAYFFTYAQNEETQNAEMEMMFQALAGKKFDYPIALDIEDTNTASIGKAALTNLVKRGLDIIDQKGYKPILYTYTNYKNNYLDMDKLKDYDLWLADTRSSYNGRGKSAIWQYGQETVAGITGKCDVNYCYKKYVDGGESSGSGSSGGGTTGGGSGTSSGSTGSATKAITIKNGTWNVRKGPGTQYASVGVITSPDAKTGKKVYIGYESVNNGWYKTVYGYISSAAVETEAAQQKAITFKDGTWNVRKGAGMQYPSVGTIQSPSPQNGKKKVCIGYDSIVDGWFKTVYGYVGPAAVESYT